MRTVLKAIWRFGFLALSLSACVIILATAAFSQTSKSNNYENNLPPIYGIILNSNKISIDIVSYGGTDASDFTIKLDKVSGYEYRLSIIRIKQDRGRIAPHIIRLNLEIPFVDNVDEAKFTLVNKLGITGNPSNPRALLRSDS